MGAGPAGLATGMLLSEAGIEVTVLDKDPAEPPDLATEAWNDWQRPGVAQFRQAHTLLPRGRELLEDLLPSVLSRIVSLGAHPFDSLEAPPPTIAEWTPMSGDERFRSVGARRPVYELGFALAAEESGVEVRRGVSVTAFRTGSEALPGIPHITGVETADGEVLETDLVIDAAGRRSPLPRLLEHAGATPLHEDAQDSRFVYYTRFYRRRDADDFPRPYVISLMPAGSISVLTLPGDNDSWSVTLFATTSDKRMRAVRDPNTFERVVRAIPARAQWIEGDAITDVDLMAGISDRERSIVKEGAPIATGVIPISDAWACTNPSLGRGITMAMMHIDALIPSIVESLNRPQQMVEAWHAVTETHVQPWHRSTLVADRARNKEMDAIRTGLVGPSDVASNVVDKTDEAQVAFYAAMMTDQHAFRAGLEIAGLFATPDEVTSRPEIQRIVSAAAASMPELPAADISSRARLEELLV